MCKKKYYSTKTCKAAVTQEVHHKIIVNWDICLSEKLCRCLSLLNCVNSI